MNKIQHVNIGGYPFSVNEDAYHKLDRYLMNLDQHFAGSESSKEIMEDIEFRIAELFRESLQGGSIITTEHVNQMIKVMGTVENFDVNVSDDESQNLTNGRYKTGRKMFKDPYDKKISGVCSGLAHYFGIQDPTWVRVAFVVMATWAGTGILIYLVLMFILPNAVTSADRLAMKGKSINIQNIAEKVEEEVGGMTDKIRYWRKRKKLRS